MERVYTEQKFPASRQPVWDFISSPRNLAVITPDDLKFNIITKDLPEKIFNGLKIKYNISPLFGIKMEWITEISEVKGNEFFVDIQLKGPYKYWRHEHILTEIPGGVLMTDIIKYKPPFSFIGKFANPFLIKRKLKMILDYRKLKLEEIFGRI
jgi:ligand-binding SRPBCC domain-containing protein